MRRPVVLAALTLLSFGSAPAWGQDPVEYLLEGKDRERGNFVGQLIVSEQQPGRFAVVRRAVLRAGREQQEGTGRRQADELRVRFPQSAGLVGGLGGTTPSPLRLLVLFGEEDAVVETTLERGSQLVCESYGQRVELPFGAGKPTEASRPQPESASHHYRVFTGVPFIQGAGDANEVDINDVSQGSLGDCYFMAGLAAVARAQPERIASMVEDHGDGTFSVLLWRHNDQFGEEVVGPDGSYEYKLTATRVRVDDAFPASGSSPAYAEFGDSVTVGGVRRRELWPMLFEKAYAQLKGGYGPIEGGYASTPMSFFSAEEVEDLDPAELSADELKQKMIAADRDGRPMTLGVPEGHERPALNLYAPHYYAFWGFDAQGRVLLYNPWGSSHPPRGLTFEEVKEIFDTVHVGPQ